MLHLHHPPQKAGSRSNIGHPSISFSIGYLSAACDRPRTLWRLVASRPRTLWRLVASRMAKNASGKGQKDAVIKE
jgi:hypothetical protein